MMLIYGYIIPALVTFAVCFFYLKKKIVREFKADSFTIGTMVGILGTLFLSLTPTLNIAGAIFGLVFIYADNNDAINKFYSRPLFKKNPTN